MTTFVFYDDIDDHMIRTTTKDIHGAIRFLIESYGIDYFFGHLHFYAEEAA